MSGIALKGFLKLVLTDLLLLALAIGVLFDEQWRAYHAIGAGALPSTQYSIFIQFFSLKTPSVTLTSPPTLSWVQVFVAALILVNGLFFYRASRRRASPA